MRITLYDIKLFSECPAYYTFLQEIPKKDIKSSIDIVQRVIKKCYLISTETGYKATWRRVVGLVDKHVFQNVNVEENKEFDTAKTISEHILSFISHWYENIYLPEQVMGYVDLRLEEELGSHVIVDSIPILKISEETPTIILINDIARNSWELYNDISIKGLCWLVSNTLGCDEVNVQCLSMGKQGGFQFSEITIDKDAHKRTERVLQQVIQSIAHGVDYPSVTEKCYQCPFNRRCK